MSTLEKPKIRIETPDDFEKKLNPADKEKQRAGDVAWTEKLTKMYGLNMHKDPILLSRGLLANARNMQLRQEGKKSSNKNVNVLRNLKTRLNTQLPTDPNNPSRSAEIGKSNLKTWEKTFLSLTTAVKNDVIDTVDGEQKLAIDNALAAGNKLTRREEVVNGVQDLGWEAAKTYMPLVAIPGLIFLLMKAFKIGDNGGVMGFIRDGLKLTTVLGLLGAGWGVYKATAGAKLKDATLGTPEEPESTPSTWEKTQDVLAVEWGARRENGTAWTEIIQSIPELTKKRKKGGYAIGDLMVALHPNDARYAGVNSIKTSDAEVTRAKKFVQEFTRTHALPEAQFKTMVEEIWRSNTLHQGDAFQAQVEKNRTVGDVAKYVDDSEGVLSNTLQALTGVAKERKMFAKFVENRPRMNRVPMGDILHIFNENVPGVATSYITWMANGWVDKIDVTGIPQSGNFAANKANVLLNMTDDDRLYMRKLFNTIWLKQQKAGNNDPTKAIKDVIHIPESIV